MRPTLVLALSLAFGLDAALAESTFENFIPKLGDHCVYKINFGPKDVVVDQEVKLVDETGITYWVNPEIPCMLKSTFVNRPYNQKRTRVPLRYNMQKER